MIFNTLTESIRDRVIETLGAEFSDSRMEADVDDDFSAGVRRNLRELGCIE